MSESIQGRIRVLIVQSEQAPATLQELCRVLEGWTEIHCQSFRLEECQANSAHLAEALSTFQPAVVFICGSGFPSAWQLSQLRQSRSPQIEDPLWIVVGSSSVSVEIAEAYEPGVTDVWLTPLRPEELRARLKILLATKTASFSDKTVADVWGRSVQIIGESSVLLHELAKIPQLAASNFNVFIGGETGTGKELCARAIHYTSARNKGAFIPVNCSTISPDLFENELFGHDVGAYTGAGKARTGLVQEADGGTLFLDEIDTLALGAQAKILRFVQDGQLRRVGAVKYQEANTRIIAASNVSLPDAIRAGRFREDLYFRINVLNLTLPPLRMRQTDLRLLVAHFLEKFTISKGKSLPKLSSGVWQKIMTYPWPGNVRELENVIARAVALSPDGQIQDAHIEIGETSSPKMLASFNEAKAQVVREFEEQFLRISLMASDGNISKAARLAGKERRTYWALLRKHQLCPC